MVIKFKEYGLIAKTYTAEEVIEVIKSVEQAVREGYYINVTKKPIVQEKLEV